MVNCCLQNTGLVYHFKAKLYVPDWWRSTRKGTAGKSPLDNSRAQEQEEEEEQMIIAERETFFRKEKKRFLSAESNLSPPGFKADVHPIVPLSFCFVLFSTWHLLHYKSVKEHIFTGPF